MKMLQTKWAVSGVLTLMGLAHLLAPTAFGQTLSQTKTSAADIAASAPATFERTLREFVKMAAADPMVGALLSKHRVVMEYTVADLDLHCYVGFAEGKVVGAFGQPARQSELDFVSNAGTLDRLLRGEDCQSEMQVSVHLDLLRKLSLKRDLKRLRAALVHVYAIARETVSSRAGLLAEAH